MPWNKTKRWCNVDAWYYYLIRFGVLFSIFVVVVGSKRNNPIVIIRAQCILYRTVRHTVCLHFYSNFTLIFHILLICIRWKCRNENRNGSIWFEFRSFDDRIYRKMPNQKHFQNQHGKLKYESIVFVRAVERKRAADGERTKKKKKVADGDCWLFLKLIGFWFRFSPRRFQLHGVRRFASIDRFASWD